MEQARRAGLSYLRAGLVKRTALFVLAFFIAAAGLTTGTAARSNWSNTEPEVNLSHIFEGGINSHGKPVGLHVAPDKAHQDHARIKKILSRPNNAGVYTAIVEIFDIREKRWKEKFSSFFPDYLSKQDIIRVILTAFSRNTLPYGAKWRGPSGRGFLIEGYRTKRGGINTAYPVYIAD